MPTYEPVIGLEIHAQLKTNSKLFCSCSTAFGAEPNNNICPVCSGQPGALPVLNKKAVEFALRAGLAMHCKINQKSIYARKNYFYPDLPKGYQISQFEEPLCGKGWLDIEFENPDTGLQKKRVGITRIHMEEDAGKLVHKGSDSIYGADYSIVDLNRSSTPLIEIVGEPDIRTGAEAKAYVEKIREVLRYLDICDGNLEEGSLRCDANISIRPVGQTEFGTRTEVKNMNSFKAVEKAINAEIARQEKVLTDGGRIVQETRNYDDESGQTTSLRSKEDAHDYRYFPEPDLLPLIVTDAWLQQIKEIMPELAEDKRWRYTNEYKLPDHDIGVLLDDKSMADFFDATVAINQNYKAVSNWIMGDLLAFLKAEGFHFADQRVSPTQLAQLIQLIDKGIINGKTAKDVLMEVIKSGNNPENIVQEQGLTQIEDTSEIEKIIAELITANPGPVAQYKAGKESVAGFFVGQVMRATKGRAKPDLVGRLVKESLNR